MIPVQHTLLIASLTVLLAACSSAPKAPEAVHSLPEAALTSLTLQEPPQADVSSYDRLRQIQEDDHVQ